MDTDKASLDYYKLQSKKAMQVLKETLPGSGPQKIERAGIDETYVDLSVQVHEILLHRYPELAQDDQPLESRLPLPLPSVPDWEDSALEQGSEDAVSPVLDWDDICIHIGSQIVRAIRSAIFTKLHYTCSAGVARNKVLAKLGSGHNKPNRQTVILNSGIPDFLATYQFTKLRGLGRKLGNEVTQAFNTKELTDLLPISLSTLRSKLGSSDGTWVYNVIRGVEHSDVVAREHLKSVMSAKTFMPPIIAIEQADPWLEIFAHDIIARLEDLGGQRPRTIAVHVQVNGPRHPGRSKQGPVPLGARLDAQTLSRLARDLLDALEREGTTWPLVTLSVDVSNLEEVSKAKRSISTLLAAQGSMASTKDSPRQGSRTAEWPLDEATTSPLGNLKHAGASKRTLLDFQGFSNGGSNGSARHGSESSKRARFGSPSQAQTGVHGLLSTPPPNVGDVLANETPKDSERAGMTGSMEGEDKLNIEHSYLCPTCNNQIAEANVLEHLDWHAAMDLQGAG